MKGRASMVMNIDIVREREPILYAALAGIPDSCHVAMLRELLSLSIQDGATFTSRPLQTVQDDGAGIIKKKLDFFKDYEEDVPIIEYFSKIPKARRCSRARYLMIKLLSQTRSSVPVTTIQEDARQTSPSPSPLRSVAKTTVSPTSNRVIPSPSTSISNFEEVSDLFNAVGGAR